VRTAFGKKSGCGRGASSQRGSQRKSRSASPPSATTGRAWFCAGVRRRAAVNKRLVEGTTASRQKPPRLGKKRGRFWLFVGREDLSGLSWSGRENSVIRDQPIIVWERSRGPLLRVLKFGREEEKSRRVRLSRGWVGLKRKEESSIRGHLEIRRPAQEAESTQHGKDRKRNCYTLH